MKYRGNQLIFISQIKRDGSGVEEISADYLKLLQKEEFKVIILSMSQHTYIAHGFNSFVVRIRVIQYCTLFNNKQKCAAFRARGIPICIDCVHENGDSF